MEKKTVDIIIPTYKPTERFIKLIDMLESQSYEVNHIYIVNTQEEYYNSLFYGRKLESRYDNISVKHISKMESLNSVLEDWLLEITVILD